MYTRVLMADDELLSRNRLRQLINWETNGYMLAGEAEDGLQAVRLIERLQPQIVILDIDMPMMDGVSLCKYISEHHKEVETIILSNYDHFEYVRDTLNSGAVDYLLKHRISRDQLLQVLHKAEVNLRNKSGYRQLNAGWMQTNRHAAPNARHLAHLLLGTPELPRAEELRTLAAKELSFYRKNTVVIGMQLLHDSVWMADRQEDNRQMFYNSVSELCQQLIGDLSKGCAAYVGHNRFVFILSYSEFNSEAPIHQSVRSFADKVGSSMQLIYNASVYLSCSSICYQPAMIPAAYREACKQLDLHFRADNKLPERPVALASEVLPVTLSISQEKELLAAIVICNTVKIDSLLDEIFEHFSLNVHDYGQIFFLVEEMINIAHRVGRKSGANVNWISKDLIRNSPQSGQIQEINSWMKSIFRRLTEEMNLLQSSNKYSNYVAEAMKWIRTRYMEDLTQEAAAAAIGITPSYLSKIFKEETGMSFSESLNHYKVELSKQYIESGNKKIKEIYRLAGFNNYNYFFKVFKDIVGETPHAYAMRFNIPSR